MPNKDKYFIKDNNKVQSNIQLEDTERIKIERALCEAKNVNYPETFENEKQREFEYYRRLFPQNYSIHIDQVWRVLDERDGNEYIIYHVYRYVIQNIMLANGEKAERIHEIDSYEGFYHDPKTNVRQFNPDGTVGKAEIIRLDKVYTIPWSKEAFDKLIDDPLNKIATTKFALGIASQDASRDVPVEGSTQAIRNRSDFSDHDWDTTLQLGKSNLSRNTPSIHEIKKTLELRKQLNNEKQVLNDTSITTTIKANPKQMSSPKTNDVPTNNAK